jgi:hypothetical protein
MDLPRALIGSLIGAIVGIVIWIVLAFAIGMDLTIFVIALGAAVGFAVRVATKGVQDLGYGIVAALVALAAIVVGNYVVTYAVTERLVGVVANKLVPPTDDVMIAQEAHTLASQRVRVGAPLTWPEGKSMSSAKVTADYPAEIAQQATKLWESKTDKDRLKEVARVQDFDTQTGIVRSQRQNAFSDTFGLLNLLWTLLALGGAFFLGFGSKPKEGDDDSGVIDDGTGVIRARDA